MIFEQIHRPGDFILFARIFLFAATVPLLFRLKLVTLERFVAPKISSVVANQETIEKIINYVELARQTGYPLVRRRCLTRGLTLYYFLSRAGLNVELCFGMGDAQNQFLGHCWLTKEEVPFLEAEDPRPKYTIMHRFPSRLSPATSEHYS